MLARINGTTIAYELDVATPEVPDAIQDVRATPATRVTPAASAAQSARRARAPTVLLCSGAGEGPELWNIGLGPELVEAGFTVVTYSYRGIAPSSCPDGPIPR